MGEAFHLKAKSVLRYFKIRVTFTVFILWIQRINWETHLIFFCQKFGVPENITYDGSKDKCMKVTEFMKQF